MFSVNLNNEEGKQYYAFDEGELYQLRLLLSNNTFSLDNKMYKIFDLEANDGSVEVTFVNICPVLVKKEDYESKLNLSRYSMDYDFLEAIPITKREYEMLKDLAFTQTKDSLENKEKNQVKNEIRKSCQYVKKHLDPSYKYKTY